MSFYLHFGNRLETKAIQWGSENWTSQDFEWSKRGWVANGPDLELYQGNTLSLNIAFVSLVDFQNAPKMTSRLSGVAGDKNQKTQNFTANLDLDNVCAYNMVWANLTFII